MQIATVTLPTANTAYQVWSTLAGNANNNTATSNFTYANLPRVVTLAQLAADPGNGGTTVAYGASGMTHVTDGVQLAAGQLGAPISTPGTDAVDLTTLFMISSANNGKVQVTVQDK